MFRICNEKREKTFFSQTFLLVSTAWWQPCLNQNENETFLVLFTWPGLRTGVHAVGRRMGVDVRPLQSLLGDGDHHHGRLLQHLFLVQSGFCPFTALFLVGGAERVAVPRPATGAADARQTLQGEQETERMSQAA